MKIDLYKLSQKPSIKYLMLQGSVLLTSIAAGLVTYLVFLFIPETTAWGLFTYLLTAWVLIFPFGILYAFLGFIISIIIRRDKWLYSIPIILLTFIICVCVCSFFQNMCVYDNGLAATDTNVFSIYFWVIAVPGFVLTFLTVVLPIYLILLTFDFIITPPSDSPPLSSRDRFWLYIKLFGGGLFGLICELYILSMIYLLFDSLIFNRT